VSVNYLKPVVIIGAGGHARVVADMLRCSGREILGVITPDLCRGEDVSGLKVLGDDRAVCNYPPETIELANGIGALPAKKLRWSLAKRFREKGFCFSTVIHPGAIIARDVSLAEGVQVMAGAVLQPGVIVGHDTIINTRVSLDHDCRIAECCHIAPGVTLSGDVQIGRLSHIGTGACAVHGVCIGSEVIVAAGSVVYRDIPDHVIFIQDKQEKTLHNI
jgi:UDP-perosamine 4-acetyltransferase